MKMRWPRVVTRTSAESLLESCDQLYQEQQHGLTIMHILSLDSNHNVKDCWLAWPWSAITCTLQMLLPFKDRCMQIARVLSWVACGAAWDRFQCYWMALSCDPESCLLSFYSRSLVVQVGKLHCLVTRQKTVFSMIIHLGSSCTSRIQQRVLDFLSAYLEALLRHRLIKKTFYSYSCLSPSCSENLAKASHADSWTQLYLIEINFHILITGASSKHAMMTSHSLHRQAHYHGEGVIADLMPFWLSWWCWSGGERSSVSKGWRWLHNLRQCKKSSHEPRSWVICPEPTLNRVLIIGIAKEFSHVISNDRAESLGVYWPVDDEESLQVYAIKTSIKRHEQQFKYHIEGSVFHVQYLFAWALALLPTWWIRYWPARQIPHQILLSSLLRHSCESCIPDATFLDYKIQNYRATLSPSRALLTTAEHLPQIFKWPNFWALIVVCLELWQHALKPQEYLKLHRCAEAVLLMCCGKARSCEPKSPGIAWSWIVVLLSRQRLDEIALIYWANACS